MSAAPSSSLAPEFQDLILTMDVVDALRNEERHLQRVVLPDDDVQQLSERLQKAYSEQGIDVSPELIERGIRARHDSLFSYFPPANSLQVVLAKLYIQRVRVAAILGTTTLLVGSLFAVALYVMSALEAKARRAQLAPIETQLSTLRTLHKDLKSSVAQATGKAGTLLNDRPEVVAAPVSRLTGEANEQLDEWAQSSALLHADALRMTAEAVFDEGMTEELNNDLQRLQDITSYFPLEALVTAETLVEQANRRGALQAELNSLMAPARLKQQWDRVDSVLSASLIQGDVVTAEPYLGELQDVVTTALGLQQASEQYVPLMARMESIVQGDDARGRTAALRTRLAGAMDRGDVDELSAIGDEIDALYVTLDAAYSLNIVSRPNAKSGVWRYPKSNQSARNYYLIVEAVDVSGASLERPVTSEETGRTETVTRWGLRVDEATFEAVKVDKQHDGIIDRNVIGRKRRGFLNPEYLIATTGGAITRW